MFWTLIVVRRTLEQLWKEITFAHTNNRVADQSVSILQAQEHKIVIYYFRLLRLCCGFCRNRLIEAVLLNTYNICLVKIKEIFF